MTGDLVKAMIGCGRPIISAIDGICAGAGAIIAMASDMRFATPSAKTAFLFTRVGLAGCDMGACAMPPRIIGQGRAADLLYGSIRRRRFNWGFITALSTPSSLSNRRLNSDNRLPMAPRSHTTSPNPTQPRMVDGARASDRIRSTGTGYLHANSRLRARLQSVRSETDARVRRY